jgi:hypothetical protein
MRHLVLLTVIATIPYIPSKWVFVIDAGNDDGYYYMSSIQKQDAHTKRAWIKEEAKISTALEGSLARCAIGSSTYNDNETPYTYTHADSAALANTALTSLFYTEFDFMNKRYRILEWENYYFDGHKGEVDMGGDWHYAIPSTVMDTIMNYAGAH